MLVYRSVKDQTCPRFCSDKFYFDDDNAPESLGCWVKIDGADFNEERWG